MGGEGRWQPFNLDFKYKEQRKKMLLVVSTFLIFNSFTSHTAHCNSRFLIFVLICSWKFQCKAKIIKIMVWTFNFFLHFIDFELLIEILIFFQWAIYFWRGNEVYACNKIGLHLSVPYHLWMILKQNVPPPLVGAGGHVLGINKPG